jgi:hypothetical protein
MREVAGEIKHTLHERFHCRVPAARYERMKRRVLRVCAYVRVRVMCVVKSSSMCVVTRR